MSKPGGREARLTTALTYHSSARLSRRCAGDALGARPKSMELIDYFDPRRGRQQEDYQPGALTPGSLAKRLSGPGSGRIVSITIGGMYPPLAREDGFVAVSHKS